jgi:hypothetical protein
MAGAQVRVVLFTAGAGDAIPLELVNYLMGLKTEKKVG